ELITHKQRKPTMKGNTPDDDRPGITRRQLLGLATLTSAGLAAASVGVPEGENKMSLIGTQALQGVGQNFQDHPAIGCVWEYEKPLPPRTGSVTFFWKSDPSLDTPDIQTCQAEVPFAAAEMLARYNAPAGSWSMFAGIVRPKSR